MCVEACHTLNNALKTVSDLSWCKTIVVASLHQLLIVGANYTQIL